jgi:hypothetical protein
LHLAHEGGRHGHERDRAALGSAELRHGALSKSVVQSLRPAARARDLSVQQLIVELVEVAAGAQLIAAIVDDHDD